MTKRLYVLPLMGAKLVYYRAELPWAFAIQVSTPCMILELYRIILYIYIYINAVSKN